MELKKENVPESMLGLRWNWQSDTFSYKHRPLIYETPSLRNIYNVATQYNALGLLLPYTTSAKVIIKHLWNKQRGWDDPNLPPNLLCSLIQWEEVCCLPSVSFPWPYVNVQGSRFKVILFVTYSIIQDIIGSEM